MSNSIPKIRIIIITGFAFLLCVLILFISVFQIKRYHTEFISSQESIQGNLITWMEGNITNRLSTDLGKGISMGDAEDNVVNEILSLNQAGNNIFWIFASDSELLFYQNMELTENKKGMTMESLLENYSFNGGYNVNTFSRILETGNDNTVEFSMGKDQSEYLGIIRHIKVSTNRYTLIYCINEDYILKSSGGGKLTTVFMIVSVMSVVSIISLAIFMLHLMRNNNHLLDRNVIELQRKNALITEMNLRLHPNSDYSYYGQSQDSVSGIYNEKFGQIILADLEAQTNITLQIGVLGIRWKKKLMLNDMFTALQKELGSQFLLTKFTQDTYGFVGFKMSRKEFLLKMNHAINVVCSIYKRNKLKIFYEFSIRDKEEDSIYFLLDQASDRLKLNKKYRLIKGK